MENITKFNFTNIQGLRANHSAVRNHLEYEKPHLLFLTETSISSASEVSSLHIHEYNLESKFKRRNGVCVYIRHDVEYTRLSQLEKEEHTVLWLRQHKCVYACVYRSPGFRKEENTLLFNHLHDTAMELTRSSEPFRLIILGDLNAHHKTWIFPRLKTDNAGMCTYKLAKSLHLSQLIDEPTRVPRNLSHTANCLDLLMVSEEDMCCYNTRVVYPLGGSDHRLIKAEFVEITTTTTTDESPSKRRKLQHVTINI